MSDEEIEVEALGRLRAEGRRVVVVDVRSAEEYAAGHVAGARHVPGAELAARVDELRGAGLVVTACGKAGGRSAEGAALLRSLGVRAPAPRRRHVRVARRTPRGSERAMNTLFVVNDAPYGTERAYNALRLAASVARHEGQRVRLSRTSGSTPRRRWCTARSRSSRCRSWASASTTCSRCTRSGCCRALERRLALGPLRYLLNGPQMHIFHHAEVMPFPRGANFGVVLFVWDWLFGTAWVPDEGRGHTLGFDGVARYPRGFLAQVVEPLLPSDTTKLR